MENAHVLICLRNSDVNQTGSSGDTAHGRSPARSGVGVRRTSATSVRLEHSDMSPGVASISFEQVFDHGDTNAQVFEQSLASAVKRAVLDGSAMTVVATGAALAGKSFCMHGDQEDNNKQKGLIELGIERAFDVASESDEWQVLVAAGYTKTDKVQGSASFLDALNGTPLVRDPADAESTQDSAFLSRAMRVSSVGEAVLAYASALRKCTQEGRMFISADFVCVLYVESRSKSPVVRRSRLCFIDVHGNSIIEPTSTGDQHEGGMPTIFAETQFPVNEVLSGWCGGLVGNASSTFFVVAIPTSTKNQQLAIQSLLYACKAKELKSNVEVCEVEEFSSATNFSDLDNFVDEPEDQDGVLMCLGSPVSSVSSIRSTPKRAPSGSDLLSQRLRQAYQSVKNSSGTKSPELTFHTQSEVSDDADISSQGVNTQTLHARADSILRSTDSKLCNLETMSLVDKLDSIAAHCRQLEVSFQHEASVKKKCVERISKLSQTMSFQVVEHEKQLKARDTENHGLRVQLQNMQSMYDNAEQTLETLQVQVEAMKVSMRERASARSPVKASNERLLLQQFSSRLEAAMLEAKAVVDQKDGVIRGLEASVKQLQEAKDTLEKAWALKVTQLKENESGWVTEQVQWENERAQWIHEKTEWESEKARWVAKSGTWRQEKARLLEEKTIWEEEKERWHLKLNEERAHVTDWAEKQSQWAQAEAIWAEEKSKWCAKERMLEAAVTACRDQINAEKEKTDECVDRLAAAERTWAAKMAKLEKALESEREDGLRKMKSELSLREARIMELESIITAQDHDVTQARHELEALEREKQAEGDEISNLQAKLEDAQAAHLKEKNKLEKKLRVMMNERRQQLDEAERIETEMASEVERLGLELEALRADNAAKNSELARTASLVIELQNQVDRLEKQCTIGDEQIAELQECKSRLQMTEKTMEDKVRLLTMENQGIREELEHRTYRLEQQAAQQLLELETRLSSDQEQRVRDLMERQSSELLQRDLELRRLRNRRPQHPAPVSSSSSSSSSSSCERVSHKQHDLEHLGAGIDNPSSRQQQKGKRLEDKVSKQKHKIALLRNQIDSLTHALAVANEQESLAKEAIELQQASYERMMYAQDELQTQVNALKEENWSLSLALQVTEKRGPDVGRADTTFLPLSSRIAEC